MTSKFELDPGLREFATDRQWELLEAWAEAGSADGAATKLGCAHSLLDQAKLAVVKKAAKRGWSPQAPVFHTGRAIPIGFVLRGQSALVDATGNMAARWDKTKQEGLDPEEAKKLPDPKKTVKLSTMTDSDGKVIVQWVSEKPEDIAKERAWLQFAKELAADIPHIAATLGPSEYEVDKVVGFPVGDHHLGMLSWPPETGAAYDLNIGEKLLKGAINYLSEATGRASLGVVAFLGDFMHYDSFETVTPTSRNILESDTRFPKLVRAAVRVMRYTLRSALTTCAKVHVIVEAGNHDLASSVFLAECLRIAYENEPRVTVDTSPAHYHYYRFGNVLLGTHHGHGTKMANLPLIMAADRPEDWGATQYRYFWTGHIHQSKVQPAISAQDYSGVTVESFRVLPPNDAWAQQKGYRSHRDMKAVVFHRDFGEVARHTVNPRMLEKFDAT